MVGISDSIPDLSPRRTGVKSQERPGLVEVLEARRLVGRHLSRTPVLAYPGSAPRAAEPNRGP